MARFLDAEASDLELQKATRRKARLLSDSETSDDEPADADHASDASVEIPLPFSPPTVGKKRKRSVIRGDGNHAIRQRVPELGTSGDACLLEELKNTNKILKTLSEEIKSTERRVKTIEEQLSNSSSSDIQGTPKRFTKRNVPQEVRVSLAL